MVIILNGPLGIGKSTTGAALTRRFDRAVHLDVDHAVDIHPFDFYDTAQLEYICETVGVLVEHHHRRAGYADFVTDWVFETPALLERLRRHLEPLGLPILAFRLTCAPEALEARIRRRNLPDVDWEVERGLNLLAILNRAAHVGDLGTVVDTSHLTPEAAADVIWWQARSG